MAPAIKIAGSVVISALMKFATAYNKIRTAAQSCLTTTNKAYATDTSKMASNTCLQSVQFSQGVSINLTI